MEDIVQVIVFLVIALIGLLGSSKKKPVRTGPPTGRPKAPERPSRKDPGRAEPVALEPWEEPPAPERVRAEPKPATQKAPWMDPFSEDEIIERLRLEMERVESGTEIPVAAPPPPPSPDLPLRRSLLKRTSIPVRAAPAPRPSRSRPSIGKDVRRILTSGGGDLRSAVVLGLILGPPKSLEHEGGGPGDR